MDFKDRASYQQLSIEVDKDNEIQSALKEGYELLRKAEIMQGVKGTDLEKRFEKEYEDLYKAIKESIRDNRKISKEERAKIMLELSDMVELASEHGVGERKPLRSKLGDLIKGTNTEDAKDKSIDFRKKTIEDYSPDEAVEVINYLSNNYSSYKKVEDGDSLSKATTFNYSSVDQLDDQYEVRLFQDMLAKKVFGEGKGFTREYLLGFNKERGNFVIKTSDFENDLKNKNIKDINSLALSNYFLYLESTGELSVKKLITTFGENSLLELESIWLNNKDSHDPNKLIAKKALEKKGILQSILKLIEVFSSPEKFLQQIGKTDFNDPNLKEKQELAIEFLKNNVKGIKERIENDLLSRYLKNNPGKTKEDGEKVVKEIMSELRKYKKVDQIQNFLKTFIKYNEEYKLGIDIGENTENLYKLFQADSKLTIAEASKKLREARELEERSKMEGNHEAVLAARRLQVEAKRDLEEAINDERHAEMSGRIVSRMSNETANDVASGKTKIEDVIEQLRKEDDEFDRYFKDFEEKQKKYEENNSAKNKNKESQENKNQKPQENSNETSAVGNFEYEQKANGGVTVKIDNGEKVEFSRDEFNKLKNNKENLESVIDFYKELKEAGMLFVWNYRDFFTKTIFSFDVQNGIKEDELLKLYNFIGTQIGKNWDKLVDARNDLRRLNRGIDIGSEIKGDDLKIPEASINSIHAGVLFTYLIKQEYFVNGDLIESKWKK